MEIQKKNWFRRHPIWTGIISFFLILFIIGIFVPEADDSVNRSGGDLTGQVISDASSKETEQTQREGTVIESEGYNDYDLEMSINELLNQFSGLTKLQQEEKIKELKGKRIKTSTTAYKVSKASLSTQYVVMDDDSYYPSVKAFFPAEEKDRLLNINMGDKIVFIGEFVTYKEGTYVPSYVEFTKSKLIR